MKKVLLGAAIIAALASCDKKDKPADDAATAKDTLTTELPAPEVAPAAPADTVAKAETDGTSVSVSKDGVNVTTTDAEKKTEVKVDAKK